VEKVLKSEMVFMRCGQKVVVWTGRWRISRSGHKKVSGFATVISKK
jgi:hypothetical protein